MAWQCSYCRATDDTIRDPYEGEKPNLCPECGGQIREPYEDQIEEESPMANVTNIQMQTDGDRIQLRVSYDDGRQDTLSSPLPPSPTCDHVCGGVAH